MAWQQRMETIKATRVDRTTVTGLIVGIILGLTLGLLDRLGVVAGGVAGPEVGPATETAAVRHGSTDSREPV